MEGIKASGSARFAFYESGALVDEWYPFGNQTEMTVEPTADTVEIASTDDSDYGVTLDSETEPASVKVTAATNRFSPETLALMFSAAATLDTTAGATVSTPVAFTAKMGVAHRIGGTATPRTGITSYVLKDATDTTTYVLNTDYTLDAEYGFVTPIGTTIETGDVLHETFVYETKDDYKLDINSAPSRHIAFFWKSTNRFNGKHITIDIPKTTVKATKALDLMGKDPGQVSWEFTPIKLDGYSSSVIIRKDA
jgi:hypothetical protein